MKQALSIFDERAPQDGWAYCANIHDEVQIEAHPDVVNFVAETMCVAIRDAGHRLELNCLMDGSFNIGNNWSETH